MKIPGIVTNVTAFGAFVDVGVHQDGLVHISELSDRFVSNPHNVVKVNQEVMVSVLDVDLARKRIALSMKAVPGEKQKGSQKTRQRVKKTTRPKGSPDNRTKPTRRPFHNPFADALKKSGDF